MNAVAQVFALLAALAYLGAAPLEMFLYEKPWARRFLHVDTTNVDDVRMWAFVVGFRNMLAGLGTVVGLALLWSGDEQVGRTVVVVTCCYMLLASLAMGISDLMGLWRPRGGSVLGTIGSSVFPAVALVATWGWS